jgi:hypothetical protein
MNHWLWRAKQKCCGRSNQSSTVPVSGLAKPDSPEPGWQRFGPIGSSAFHMQRSIARLLWLAVNQRRGVAELPAGWAHGKSMEPATIRCGEVLGDVTECLGSFFWGCPDQLILWLGARFAERTNHFERGAIHAELEVLAEFSSEKFAGKNGVLQLALL